MKPVINRVYQQVRNQTFDGLNGQISDLAYYQVRHLLRTPIYHQINDQINTRIYQQISESTKLLE